MYVWRVRYLSKLNRITSDFKYSNVNGKFKSKLKLFFCEKCYYSVQEFLDEVESPGLSANFDFGFCNVD